MKTKLKLKQLAAVTIAFSIFLSFTAKAAEVNELPEADYTSTVDYSSTVQHILPLLSELKIMNGDTDGDYRLYDTVTRAEFTKIAVAASDFRNNAASQLSISPFYDVPYTNWSAPYVRVGVTNNLVSGYPDASFRPDEPVTFEEAITIMLRVLGYSDNDFGAAWPSGQIGMAENLDMTDNISNTQIGSKITRCDAAALVYNTLRAKKKDSQAELISIFNVSLLEDVTLISTAKEDSSIPGDEVFTDSGAYKIRSDFNYSLVGMKGNLAVKDNKTVIGFLPKTDENGSEKYAVYSVLSDSVIVYKNGTMSSLDISNQTSVYDGKNKTTYSAIKSSMEMGDVLSVKRTNGNIDYIVYQKGNLVGPYTAGIGSDWASSMNINGDTAIMRDGKVCTSADIQPYDILYYIPGLNMAFAYTTKITGVYTKASPNKDNPTEIEISGVTYKVEGSTAFKKLSSSGNLTIGDTITVMLGRTNAVADVLTSSVINSEIVGYVYETGSKTYTSSDLKEYSNYYINIAAPNGQTYNYPTEQNCDSYKNTVVKVSLNNGIAKITTMNHPNLSGSFSWSSKRLGSEELDDNINMLDIGTTDKNNPSLYTTVYPQRIDGISINSGKILYYHKNSNGKIDELIFNDLTGDSYTYGLVTSASGTSIGLHASGSYSYLVNGSSYSFASASSMFSVDSGDGVKLSSVNNPSVMLRLAKLEGKIELTNSAYLTCGGKNYEISDNVQVYEKEFGSTTMYRMRPISDIINNNGYSLTAYYDKSPSSGGRIRIIVASK